MLRNTLFAAKRRPLTSAIMMPIAEFSNAARHLSSLCRRASLSRASGFSRAYREPTTFAERRSIKPGSLSLLQGLGWLGATQTQGNENVRRQHYYSHLKCGVGRTLFSARRFRLSRTISSWSSNLSVSVSIFEMRNRNFLFRGRTREPLAQPDTTSTYRTLAVTHGI